MKFNRNSRVFRLLAGFILPPFIGTVFVMGAALVEQLMAVSPSYERLISAFLYMPLVFLGALFFVGIQALAYSLAMEFVVRPGVSGRRGSLAAGGLLGFFAALPPAGMLAAPLAFIPLGIIVGVIVALIICDKERRAGADVAEAGRVV